MIGMLIARVVLVHVSHGGLQVDVIHWLNLVMFAVSKEHLKNVEQSPLDSTSINNKL